MPHDSLLGQLQFYSIDGPILKCVRFPQEQCVVVDRVKSELVWISQGMVIRCGG